MAEKKAKRSFQAQTVVKNNGPEQNVKRNSANGNHRRGKSSRRHEPVKKSGTYLGELKKMTIAELHDFA